MTAIGPGRYDSTPFGDAIALDATAFLKSHNWYGDLGAIVRSHRDYTGHGLFRDHTTGVFSLSRTQDGLPMGEPLLTFPGEAEFVSWLSRQSDRTLSGYLPTGSPRFDENPGNQRVTRQLILDHIFRAKAR